VRGAQGAAGLGTAAGKEHPGLAVLAQDQRGATGGQAAARRYAAWGREAAGRSRVRVARGRGRQQGGTLRSTGARGPHGPPRSSGERFPGHVEGAIAKLVHIAMT
jgi:hypothetical protein